MIAWISVCVFIAYKNQQQVLDFKTLELMAPRHSSAEYPFYAQFSVSQTLNFNKPRLLNHIEIPMLNKGSGPVEVDVVTEFNGGILENHKIQLPVNANYLKVPVFNKDKVEYLKVVLSASNISVQDKKTAPIVFHEPSELGFQNGIFSVADIHKKGNIALTVYARQTKFEQEVEEFERHPIFLAKLSRDFCLLLLLIFSPALFYFSTVDYRKENHK